MPVPTIFYTDQTPLTGPKLPKFMPGTLVAMFFMAATMSINGASLSKHFYHPGYSTH
jgi:hypothetical protein